MAILFRYNNDLEKSFFITTKPYYNLFLFVRYPLTIDSFSSTTALGALILKSSLASFFFTNKRALSVLTNSLFNLLRGFGIKEAARTGRIAMTRGGSGPLPVEERLSRTRSKKQKAP